MTLELTCLLILSGLAASLWIPFIVGVNTTPAEEGSPSPFIVPPDPLRMKPWLARAYRAHQNLLEQLLPFGLVVLIAAHLDISTSITRWTAVMFVVLRILHAVGMITGTARMPVRPIIFTAGYVAIMVLIWQVAVGA